MNTQFYIQRRTFTYKDYAVIVINSSNDVAINIFDFCVRNYKRHIHPVCKKLYC